ncbi:MAG: hypothetical protein Q4A28_08320 [Brachymonas sp.]|nr:hypothetical protein [Brachymonas sp.]
MSSEVLSPQITIPPFWKRLNKFFLLPLQTESLTYALGLAACSLFLYVPLLDLAVGLLIALAVGRYAFKIAALSSYGIFKLDDYTPMEEEEDWKSLPWKFVGAIFIQLVALLFVIGTVPEIAPVGFLIFALLLPATMMVLIKEHSLALAINPQELWRCVAGIGWPYLVLCALTFLLMQGSFAAAGLLSQIIPIWLLLPGLTAVFIYFFWVIAALIGYTMYQYHQTLDIDVVNEYTGEEDERQPLSASREEARQRDGIVSRMVQQGALPGAIVQARQWLHDHPDSLADHRRYHRVLLLAAEEEELPRHGQRFIELLLKNRSYAEALQVYKDCAHKAPGYLPESAAVTWVLAKNAWKTQDSALTLQLLRGFDRRFPKHPLVPEVYALIARVLHLGLGRHEQAVAVLRSLQRRYPNDPHTLDVARMLAAQHPPARVSSQRQARKV